MRHASGPLKRTGSAPCPAFWTRLFKKLSDQSAHNRKGLFEPDWAKPVRLTHACAWLRASLRYASRLAIVIAVTCGFGCARHISGGTTSSEVTLVPIPASAGVTPASAQIFTNQSQQFSAVVRDSSAGIINVPVTWSSENPSVASISGNGLASAVSPGTAHITATTPNGISASAALIVLALTTSVSTSQPDNSYCSDTGTWTGAQNDGPANLPLNCFNTAIGNTPSPGRVLFLPAGADLNQAYANLECGQTLLLQHGAAWTGPFTFTAKNCDDQHWITISSDGELPSEGTRITPTATGELAQINLRPNSPPNTFGDHLRFIGVEWSKLPGPPLTAMLSADSAVGVIFDRNYCHGNPGEETRRCLTLGNNSSHIAMIESWASEFHCIAVTGSCTDSQAISGGSGTTVTTSHTIKIVNNFLEAGAENILFGGGSADGCGPTDVEIRRNHFYKPIEWNPGDPSYGGIPYIVKNLFELKNGCRILVEGNVMENTWGGYTQSGWAIEIGPKNQGGVNNTNLCPLCSVTDITIRYNYVDNAGGGLSIANNPNGNGGWSAGGGRYSVHDDIFDDLQYPSCYGCTNNLNELMSTYVSADPPPNTEILHDVVLDHITEITNVLLAPPHTESAAFVLAGPPQLNPTGTPRVSNLKVTNWIVASGSFGTYPTGGGEDNCSVLSSVRPANELAACWAGDSLFSGNVLVGYPKAASDWPAGNALAPDWASLEFVNYNSGNGGDYRLGPDSSFRGTATDGTDPGANVDAVLNMIAGVR